MNPKSKAPFPGGEHVQVIDTGPQAVPPGIRTVKLIPVGDGGPQPFLPLPTRPPKKRKPVLPTATELAALTQGARAAFSARCARRVEPLIVIAADAADVVGAAALAILRADHEPWALQFFRKDFDRVRRLAKANGWTGDTPVPPEVFGPMWPEGRTPKWASKTTEPRV